MIFFIVATMLFVALALVADDLEILADDIAAEKLNK